MMLRRYLSLVLIALLLFVTTGSRMLHAQQPADTASTKYNDGEAPAWWHSAPLHHESGPFKDWKEPFVRLIAFSIPWFWAASLFLYFTRRSWVWITIRGFWDVVLAPLIVYIFACVGTLVAVICLICITYAINGNSTFFDPGFITFVILAASMCASAVGMLAPLTDFTKSESLARKLLGGVVTVLDVAAMIFTIYDIVNLFVRYY